MTWTAFKVFQIAWRLPADVYHFHSPELIPWMFLLLLRGQPIVYDVHEDFRTGIMRAIYLPRWLAGLSAWLLRCLEHIAKRCFTIVIAERYYVEIFSNGLEVLNYPRLEDFSFVQTAPVQCDTIKPRSPILLYAGGLVRHRGALIYADLAREMPDVTVRTVGIISRGLVKEMQERSNQAVNLEVVGTRRWVPYPEILEAYRQQPTLGIAIFPDTDHYRQKELTKFFEYMAAGIPIVCSNFPVWRALVADQDVGVCVDPEDLPAIVRTIRELIADEARRMAMAANGRRLAQDKYNWDLEAARLNAVYLALAQPEPSSRSLRRRIMP
jgi:glycosyltransferase involved in cell wall biosynthesis